MSRWPSSKARIVLQALLRTGWSVKRHGGTSHRILAKIGWPDFVFAFHEGAVLITTAGKGLPAATARHSSCGQSLARSTTRGKRWTDYCRRQGTACGYCAAL